MFFQKGTRQVWRLFGALVGLIIVVVAVWGRLGGLDRAGTLEIGQIRPVDGRMYSIAPPPARFPFVSPQDSVAAPFASNLRLFESGHQLGPAHSLHVAIQDSGRGAYSHWNSALLFSTGDNSDPTKNGRSYSFSRTIFLNPWIAAGLILLGGLLGWPAIADFSRRENIKGRLAAIFAAPRTTARLVIAYILLLCVPAVLLFLAIGARTAPQTIAAFGANRPLTDRIAAYLQDPKPYSAIFLGDSRTYCDIHPELLESFVPGMHALNLSNFSNWFPTQLGVVREIANRIPPGTQVIWSIGHQNFSSSRIPVVYPIGFADALRLTWWNAGKAPNGLSDNLYHYHWYLHGFIAVREFRNSIEQDLKRPLPSGLGLINAAQAADTGAPDKHGAMSVARALEREAGSEPDVVQASAVLDDGRINSIIRYFRRGGHHRTELDTGYFRAKQAEIGQKPLSEESARAYKINPPARMEWGTFIEILEIFSAGKIRLIVNELEEAPFMYRNPHVREKYRSMMRELVQPEVEHRGFVYIRTDLDQLSNDDYFDYNHMNSKGIAKYTPMLAQRLNELAIRR